VSRSTTSTLNAMSASFSIIVYKALPTLILRDVSALQSALQLANRNAVKFADPSGTASLPSVVFSTSAYVEYEFYAIIGTSTDILSTPQGVTATCHAGSNDKNCVIIEIISGTSASCAQTGNCNGGTRYVVAYANWTNGQPGTGPYSSFCPSPPGLPDCSQSVTRLTGISNICGTAFCYKFSLFVGDINTLWGIPWLYLSVEVFDSSSTSSTSGGFGYVANADGFFNVDGIVERPSDASTPLGGSVSFQFNATISPNSITSVTMSIFNQTSSSTKIICLIGGAGCLQATQTMSASFLLYSPSTIVFAPGTYIVTVTFAASCTFCGQSSLQVLSLILVIAPTAWSENGLVSSRYLYETNIVNNATGTQIFAAGLTENLYINGVLNATLQTDQYGNAAFPWQPSAIGEYTIEVVFPGQSYYTNSSATIMVSVARRNVVLTVTDSLPSPLVNQKESWNVYAYDMLDSNTVTVPVTLFINGFNTTTVSTNSMGNAVFAYNFTSKGSYNVTFVSATTNIYSSAKSYNSISVYLNTTLTIQAGLITVGLPNSITVTLKDQNGIYLASRAVQIRINGASYANVTTGGNGQASFNWQPTSTGNYTVTASYSATGSSDIGYEPVSASAIVNVKPQTIINTQTSGSGSQSVAFNTAQGSIASTVGAPSYSFQYSLSSATVTLQFNGRQSQATVSTWNEFGWACVAKVFGTCVLKVPYWKLHEDLGVPGVFDLHMASFVPFGPPSVSYDLSIPAPFDEASFELGAGASITIPTVGTAIILAGIVAGGSLDPAVVGGAGEAVASGVLTALLAGFFTLSRPSFKSYLAGLLSPAILGLPCALGVCPPEAPVSGVEIAQIAVFAWAGYFLPGILAVLSIEGFIGMLFVGLALLLVALMYFQL
jgi:hypothetical protein